MICRHLVLLLTACGLLFSPSVYAGKVTLGTIPANAQIVQVNPDTLKTIRTLALNSTELKLRSKDVMFVRAEMQGFVPSKVIRLDRKSPKNVTLVLTDWTVTITGSPADADIVVNGAVKGKGSVDIIVARDEKVEIELQKPGFQTEKIKPALENKKGTAPPVKIPLALRDWAFSAKTTAGTTLFINNLRKSGPIVIPQGKKVDVRIEKEGFAPKSFSFENLPGKQPPTSIVDLAFDRMLVLVTTRTPGAQITTVPAQTPGVGTKLVEINRDSCVEVNVTMPGHEIISRKYCFLDGEPAPPAKDVIPALRPAVQIRVQRPMGTRIFIDGVQVGNQTATVPLPANVTSTCYTLRIEKEGFVPLEELRCDATPLIMRELRDRLLPISVSPPSADIIVDGRKVGTGRAEVIIRDQQKVSVQGRKVGFVSSTPIEFANVNGSLSPPQASTIQLLQDQAFLETVSASDQANKNFTIEVNPDKDNDKAWRLLSLIVLNAFDVIEVTDKDTGYIRSAWEVKDFGKTLVRTRIIVKLGDIEPLKYVVKLVSEHGEKPPANAPIGTEVKFREFPRLLPKYKDIINEVTFRLR